MGAFDKAKHQAEQLVGKAKETVGKATGNDDLKHAGQRERLVGQAKEAATDAKDKVTGAAKDLKNKLGGDKA